MPPLVRPLAAIHNEWTEVLRHLIDRLRSKRVTLCLPYLPGKGRANIQPIFEPEKGEDGWGEQLKRELYELINSLRAKEEKTTLLEGPNGVLGVIKKLEDQGCPIGDEQAFTRLAARFGVQVAVEERSMRRVEGGRLDPESSAQSPPRPAQANAAPLRRRESQQGLVPAPAPYEWNPKPIEGKWDGDWGGCPAPISSQAAIALDAYNRLSDEDQCVFLEVARLNRDHRTIRTVVGLRPPLNYRCVRCGLRPEDKCPEPGPGESPGDFSFDIDKAGWWTMVNRDRQFHNFVYETCECPCECDLVECDPEVRAAWLREHPEDAADWEKLGSCGCDRCNVNQGGNGWLWVWERSRGNIDVRYKNKRPREDASGSAA